MSGARLTDDEMARLGIPREYVDAIHAGTEQAEAAVAEAADHDNVDSFGLHYSQRLEGHMSPAINRKMTATVPILKIEFEPDRWRVKSELIGETNEIREFIRQESVGGKILGIVSSDDANVYVIASGEVLRWLEHIRQSQSCVVRKCYDLLPTKVSNVIIAARGQWLNATPCCDFCLKWLGGDWSVAFHDSGISGSQQ
ncbi:hypothetical protein [Mycobacterium sp. URHB0021]